MEKEGLFDLMGISLGSLMGWVIVVCGLLILAIVLFGPVFYIYGRTNPSRPLPTRLKIAIYLLGAFGLWLGIPALVGSFYS